ncbi:MAG: PhzF family phenazine biosynthesis protein [Syntrophobacteraceae bacterium]
MKLPYYQVDAFTGKVFGGNPAGVCPLDGWLDDRLLQDIAAENNLSETAFIVPKGRRFELRWFTPATEVALCGHATLASAFVVLNRLNWSDEIVEFETRRSGVLSVRRDGDLLQMDFPARPPEPCSIPEGLPAHLGVAPVEVYMSEEDLLVCLQTERQVAELTPDLRGLAALDCRGVIVTARGRDCDFVSRFFAPRVGVDEDPVTGSSHCVLIPFWSERLGKKTLFARQVSRRGGEIFCECGASRVKIGGRAALYLEGSIGWD